jgi:hypothetical protein
MLKTLSQLYSPKFVPIVVANRSMSRGSKLNKSTMGKQIEEDSSDLFIMPMDEQQPLWPLLHLLNPGE